VKVDEEYDQEKRRNHNETKKGQGSVCKGDFDLAICFEKQFIRRTESRQQTEERHTQKSKHGPIQRFRVLLMGFPHDIFMAGFPGRIGDWIPPTSQRFAPGPKSLNAPGIPT
jgi:hypothetical protein